MSNDAHIEWRKAQQAELEAAPPRSVRMAVDGSIAYRTEKPKDDPEAWIIVMPNGTTIGAGLITIAEVAGGPLHQWQPINGPHTDRIEVSISGRQRDITVGVSDVDGLTSYRIPLDLGELGRHDVVLDLFHDRTAAPRRTINAGQDADRPDPGSAASHARGSDLR